MLGLFNDVALWHYAGSFDLFIEEESLFCERAVHVEVKVEVVVHRRTLKLSQEVL